MNDLNFKISELIYSETAICKNINNMPDINSLDCLLDLIFYCLQPIRNKLNVPIIITSGYRCKEVNNLVGGVSNSQHTKGQAADFIVKKYTPIELVKIISKMDIEFDQLINEYNRWVHISFNKNNNRREILKY